MDISGGCMDFAKWLCCFGERLLLTMLPYLFGALDFLNFCKPILKYNDDHFTPNSIYWHQTTTVLGPPRLLGNWPVLKLPIFYQLAITLLWKCPPGMVGELVRKEAEIAIAPLTINSQREQVVFFVIVFIVIVFIVINRLIIKQSTFLECQHNITIILWYIWILNIISCTLRIRHPPNHHCLPNSNCPYFFF